MPLVLLADSPPPPGATCLRLGEGILSVDRVREHWQPVVSAALAEVLGLGGGSPAAGVLAMLHPWPVLDAVLMMLTVARLPADGDLFVDCGAEAVRVLGLPATVAMVTTALCAPDWALVRSVPTAPGEDTPMQRLDAAVRETVDRLAGTTVWLGGRGSRVDAEATGWQDVAELTLLGYHVRDVPRSPDAGRIVMAEESLTWILPVSGALGRDLRIGALARGSAEFALIVQAPSWRRAVEYPTMLTAHGCRLTSADVRADSVHVHFRGTAEPPWIAEG